MGTCHTVTYRQHRGVPQFLHVEVCSCYSVCVIDFPLPSMTSTQTTVPSISSSQCWTPLPGFEMRYQMCSNQMCTNNILVFLLFNDQKIRAPKEFLVNGTIRATFDGFDFDFLSFFSSDIELNDLPDSVRPNDEVSLITSIKARYQFQISKNFFCDATVYNSGVAEHRCRC